MPHFYFHLTNGNGYNPDEEGVDAASAAAARESAIDSIRSITAEESRAGVIDLTGRIDIADEAGNLLSTVHFTEAFDVNLAGGDHSSFGKAGPGMA